MHTRSQRFSTLLFVLPLCVVGFLLLVFSWNLFLGKNPQDLPPTQVNKPLPTFSVPALSSATPLSDQIFKKGKWSILNVWASWCLSCQQEHPLLQKITLSGTPLFGLALRDRPEDMRAFLETHGNPFEITGQDTLGKVSFNLGVIAVPETFLIDGQGVIRAVHRGPLTESVLDEFQKLQK